eukprot:g1137.t1
MLRGIEVGRANRSRSQRRQPHVLFMDEGSQNLHLCTHRNDPNTMLLTMPFDRVCTVRVLMCFFVLVAVAAPAAVMASTAHTAVPGRCEPLQQQVQHSDDNERVFTIVHQDGDDEHLEVDTAVSCQLVVEFLGWLVQTRKEELLRCADADDILIAFDTP